MSKNYPLTVEPMMFDRDRVVRAIWWLLDEWNLYNSCFPDNKIPLPDIRDELKYAAYYLNNDGAIREQLQKEHGLTPKFTFDDNRIGMTIEKA